METEDDLEVELNDEELEEENFSSVNKKSSVWAHYKVVGKGNKVICKHCNEKNKKNMAVSSD